jgi:hypothetical protein
LLFALNLTVIVAVVAVGMMQVVVYQVVHVIAVRNGFVATSGAVFVGLLVTAAGVLRGAGGRIRRIYRQRVLFNSVAIRMVQVAVVQIIDVAFVQDRSVAALRAVLMRVLLVLGCHL